MKLLFLHAILIVFYSCTPEKKPFKPFAPYEFDLTAVQKEQGVTRLYIDSLSGETISENLWAITDDGKERIVRLRYSGKGEKMDSTVISLTEDFYEQFTFASDKLSTPIKMSMTGEKIDDGTRFGKEKFLLEQKTRYYSSSYDAIRFYVKDTVMQFADSTVECLVFQMNSTYRFNSIIDSLNKTLPHYFTTYYGKGVGVMRSKIVFDNKIIEWILISSHPMKKEKAPIQ